MTLLYSYDNLFHKYKKIHDETGGFLSQMDFRYENCFCGHSAYEVVSTTTRHKNNFTIVRCLRCSTLRINPYMTEEFITFYYKEIYGKVKRKSVSPVDLYNMQKIRKSSAALYKKLEQYSGKDGSVLDFGAGPGGRLDEFKNQGFKDLCIFDHDEKYMEYGISQGLKADEPSKKYNIIIISHVVEHLGDPLGVLKNLAARLVPGGHMYIEVPMYENSRNLVRHFHLAHKYYFSASSLTLLAAMSGLVKVKSYKNAIVVTPGAVDTSFFSEEKAAEVWSARSRIIRRREFFRRFEWLLKGK